MIVDPSIYVFKGIPFTKGATLSLISFGGEKGKFILSDFHLQRVKPNGTHSYLLLL